MKNLRNKVQLIGRLGANPEVKQVKNGTALANMSLATSEVYRDNKGEKVTETQWHRVVVWGKKAETADKYLQKGDEIAVEGKLVNRSYEDKDGNKKYISEIVANDLLFIKTKGEKSA